LEPNSSEPEDRFREKIYRWSYVAAVVVALLPLVVAFLCPIVAALLGCSADSSGYGRCTIGGFFAGEQLDAVGLASSWLLLASVPLGGAIFIAIAVINSIHRRFWTKAHMR